MTIRLPDDLILKARRKAGAEGRSVTALIEEGLRRIVDERAPACRPARILPPVSAATDGVKRGIDLNNSAALQNLDDDERLKPAP